MCRDRFASTLAMVVLASFLVPSSLTAQITFQRTYGGASDDIGYSVQQTADGGYIVVGNTESFGAGGEDVYLVRTDGSGDTLWTRTYGGAKTDRGYSVQQTADGGYIIVGLTTSFGSGQTDIYLVKTNASGDTLWTRAYGGPGLDEGYAVQQTPDGGYVVAGAVCLASDTEDVYLMRTNPSGDTLWTRTYGGSGCDEGNSLRVTTDGGYIIAGITESFGSRSADVYLIKTNASGDTLWTRTYGGPSYDEAYSVQQTTDGGYIITGTTESFAGSVGVYLLKTNASGDTLWTRYYVPSYCLANSVQQTTDGGYVIAGIIGSLANVYLVKTNASGDTLWTRTYGSGLADDGGNSVQQTTDGGYIVAGYTTSLGAGGYDVYLIKTDSLGNVAAVAEPKTSPTPAATLSVTCEPNPFRTRTAISLRRAAGSPAALTIFDASGRCVRTFTANRTPTAIWDGTDEVSQPLPSGAYFVRLDAGSGYATTRVVLER